MLIGELSRRCGLSIDTLRFYEKIGLIAPPARNDAGRRIYAADALGWIRFLDQLNATGMKQADRILYAKLRKQGTATLAAQRQMLEAHRDTIRARQARLAEVMVLMDDKIDHYHDLEAAAQKEIAT